MQAAKPLHIAVAGDNDGNDGAPHASGDHCGPARNLAHDSAAATAAAVRGARSVHLGMMVVCPELKKRGVGARLLQSALATARGALRADVVDAHVVSVKPWLRALYERAGFVAVGRAEWPDALRPLLKAEHAQDMHFGVLVNDLRAAPPPAAAAPPPQTS